MSRVTFHVAGQSHQEALVAIVYGLPRGTPVDEELVAHWLQLRRTRGLRGPRQLKEQDRVRFLSGLDGRVTNGGPLSFLVENQDRSGRSVTPEGAEAPMEFPRPGHADWAGAQKWALQSATTVAEQASARITAAYVALGALSEPALRALGVTSLPHVLSIGDIVATQPEALIPDLDVWRQEWEASALLTLDPAADVTMLEKLREAQSRGDTVGGSFEVRFQGLPPGLGAIQPVDRRLDSRFAALLMGIPGVRAVAVGDGFEAGRSTGRAFHDAWNNTPEGPARTTNRGGGLEGGLTNGLPLVLRGVMKPTTSPSDPLGSVSLKDGKAGVAQRVRGDVCGLPGAALAAWGLASLVVLDALLEQLGSDDFQQVLQRVHHAPLK